MKNNKKCISIAVSLALLPTSFTYAQTPPESSSDAEVTEHIEIIGQRIENDALSSKEDKLESSGVRFSAAGGISALPVLNGFMGDRILVSVDGAAVTASCANQMNPPLSYVSTQQMSRTRVIAGISPVSMGGDNIAGVIEINSFSPTYAPSSEKLRWQQGSIGSTYRSNGNARSMNASLRISSANQEWAYTGSWEESDSYEDGENRLVLASLYKAENHQLSFAGKNEVSQLTARLSYQSVPYQGFPNQYMDMTDNQSLGLATRYDYQLSAQSQLVFNLNVHDVSHEMGFFSPEKVGMMPMLTEGRDSSYGIRWVLNSPENVRLQLGHEYHHYQLDDWWPPVDGMPMMSPNTFININDGLRKRIALFAEREQEHNDMWYSSFGVRVEHVSSNAGEVEPYNRMPMAGMPNMDALAADQFNVSKRAQQDTLVDVTALTSVRLSPAHTLNFGLAQKNRAPNLYERYSWGRGMMATTMIGWFGDGNGYVGDINLKPETARTASVEYQFNSPNNAFSARLKPFYTQIEDFIDANVIGTFNRTESPASARNLLQFVNLNATMAGVDAGLNYRVETQSYGNFEFGWAMSWIKGERDDTNEPLYQIMPLTHAVNVSHGYERFTTSLRVHLVSAKNRVDPRRLEQRTGAYQLVDLDFTYAFSDATISLSIENLFDEYYDLPLGGVSVAEYRKNPEFGFNQVAGKGRSLNIGFSYRF